MFFKLFSVLEKFFCGLQYDSCLKIEPQKHVSAQPKWSVGVRDIWVLPPFSRLHLFFGFITCSRSDVSQAAHCASYSDSVSLRENPEMTRAFIYLFIFLSTRSFHTVALFPKLTNVLELIEYDPLTAVWNNEASFPHIFSPRMASLPCTSVHIKVPYQHGIWGWRNYWSCWEPRPSIFTASAPRERWYYGDKSHAFRVRRQQSYSICFFCYFSGLFFVILDNSIYTSGCMKGTPKVIQNLWAIMECNYDMFPYLAPK